MWVVWLVGISSSFMMQYYSPGFDNQNICELWATAQVLQGNIQVGPGYELKCLPTSTKRDITNDIDE